MTLAHCRACNAPIIWAVTASGKNMPVDADAVVAPRGFRLEDGDTVLAVFTAAPELNERLYQSHFSTCPNAGDYRGRTR